MSKEIEARKRELTEAIEGLQGKIAGLGTLQAQMPELSSPNGGTSITAAQNHRKEVLASFVVGRASQTDLDEATMRVNELEKGAQLRAEMAEAINSAINKTEAEIQKSKAAIAGSRRRLYEAIYDELKAEIQNTSNRIYMAVAIRTRYNILPIDTLVNLFSDSGCISVIDEAARAVEREYGIEF